MAKKRQGKVDSPAAGGRSLARIREYASEILKEIEDSSDNEPSATDGSTQYARGENISARFQMRDVAFNVDLRFRGTGRDLADQINASCGPRQGAIRQTYSRGLPLDTLQTLLDQEPMMLQWLAASEKNATAFAIDPAAALVSAGAKLQRQDHKAIAAARSKNARVAPNSPGYRIATASASVSPAVKKSKIPTPKKLPARVAAEPYARRAVLAATAPASDIDDAQAKKMHTALTEIAKEQERKPG